MMVFKKDKQQNIQQTVNVNYGDKSAKEGAPGVPPT
jgi:hypothetical protein